MGSSEKILLLSTLGRGVYGRWRMQRLLPAIATVAMLAVVAFTLIGALTISGTYALYLTALHQGLSEMAALLATVIILLFLIGIVCMIMRRHICALQSSVRTPIGEAADAFLSELLSK